MTEGLSNKRCAPQPIIIDDGINSRKPLATIRKSLHPIEFTKTNQFGRKITVTVPCVK